MLRRRGCRSRSGAAACSAPAPRRRSRRAPPAPPPDADRRSSFADLPGWPEDDPERGARGVPAQLRRGGPSRRPTSAVGGAGRLRRHGRATGGPACAAAARRRPRDAARGFFETSFQPVRGQRQRRRRRACSPATTSRCCKAARVPRRPLSLSALPPPARSGQRRSGPVRSRARRAAAIGGRVREGQARALRRSRRDRPWRPCRPRARAALGRRPGRPVLSGDPGLRPGPPAGRRRSTRVGYADQNGRPYRAIGKDLIEIGAIPREQMSMQAIRAWLEANPGQAPAMMARNPLLRVLHASCPTWPPHPGRSAPRACR